MSEIQQNQNPVEEQTNVKLQSLTRLNTIPHSHMGPILGGLIMLLIIVLGGLYLWGASIHTEMQTQIEIPIANNEPETVRAKVDTQILETLSPSDDLNAIEADLTSTNLDTVDADLNAIESEFNSVQ